MEAVQLLCGGTVIMEGFLNLFHTNTRFAAYLLSLHPAAIPGADFPFVQMQIQSLKVY
jgi:hypothetical protein